MAIHYPNGKVYKSQGKLPFPQPSETVYGNRGMTLEEDLNSTNQFYREQNIAVIHKKPTPVQIVKVDYPKRSAAKITEAYFKKPSTTDYNGIYKGKYIDFEAKETRNRTALPLQNFHDHQIAHMEQVKAHGGIAFIIVKFSPENDIYVLDTDILFFYWKNRFQGGRQSIPRQAFLDHGHPVAYGYAPRIDYLKVVQSLYNL
ncbi:Holliday junction resolvase RecU [Camelliibacillus cellulosilyticus]|uniref:Holliday junction resolvase RecU n=1 Tax=Camelliibacillus cellulosilyticus TaxID=2174486 RepID=A0ABV9GHM4_9BACL